MEVQNKTNNSLHNQDKNPRNKKKILAFGRFFSGLTPSLADHASLNTKI